MKPRSLRAFTLVEVLATMVLLAVALPVAMQGVSLALRAVDIARERTESASLAEMKMQELLVTEGWRESDSSGDFGPERPEYKWEAEVVPWEDPSLQMLTVQVEWTSRGKPVRR